MKLWAKILIGMLLGLIIGLIFPGTAKFFKVFGDAFLSLIHMVILPLVFASITVGITNIHDPKKLGRVGFKTLFLYFLTTIIAVTVGLSFAEFFKPGEGVALGEKVAVRIIDTPTSVSTLLLSLIPQNPVQAFVEGKVLQVIFFSAFLGFSIMACGEKAAPLQRAMESLAAVMQKLTQLVMALSPYGVFAIMAWVAGTLGIKALYPMIKFLACYYSACIFHLLIVYGSLILGVARLNPLPLLRGSTDAIMMAFSTCSSSASLPAALRCAQDNLGVSPAISNFMLPLGTTINMNGAAIFQGMSALFICQVYGIELTLHSIITLVSVATFSAVGSAGVPGTGFIMLSVVLTSVGIPIEGLALLAGIDRVREMVSTMINILGDLVCLVVVAKQEGEIDLKKYKAANVI
jgi:dicarboxylate/amino acid:cation (Na+ or H+) symporter, DAACS family